MGSAPTRHEVNAVAPVPGTLIDISLPLDPDLMAWPGNPEVSLTAHQRRSDGDEADVSLLCLGTHSGTHIDPPRHFIDGGAGVDVLRLEPLVGPCVVADARGRPDPLTAADLESLSIPDGTRRLLLRTDNSDLWTDPAAPFPESFVSVSSEAARWIVDRGIALVGIDFLGIEAHGSDGHPTHVELLSNEVVIVEGLNLGSVEPGAYDLTVLPLRLVNGDGGPARAILRTS